MRNFGGGRTRSLLALGLLIGPGAVASSAYFSDRSAIAGVPFETGTLSVTLGGGASAVPGSPRAYTWESLNLTGLTSGASRSATITVTNASSRARFEYVVKGAATGSPGSVLNVTLREGGSLNAGVCSGGTVIANGVAITALAAPATSALAVGASRTLCATVTYSGTAPAGSTSTVTFSFDAKQVE